MSAKTKIPDNTINWTPSQRDVITCFDGNLVVAASAGSGKTAVLTERVVNLVELQDKDPNRGCRLDSMLIITFTEKAARQMRDRIEARIHDILVYHPDNKLMIQAIDDLPNAWIMTIDAFCRRVVTENFHIAGLSSVPRLIDSTGHHEMEMRVIRKLLNDWSVQDRHYTTLRKLTGTHSRGTDGLIQETRELMHFVESLDRPDSWIKFTSEHLRGDLKAEDLNNLTWFGDLVHSTRVLAENIHDTIQTISAAASKIGGDPDILKKWMTLSEQFLKMAMEPDYDHDSIREFVNSKMLIVFSRITNKSQCGDVLYRNELFKKQMLAPVRSIFEEGIMKNWYLSESRECLRVERLAAEHGLRILELVKKAIGELHELKMVRNVATFQDIARTALDILGGAATGDQPSPTAVHYRSRFRYILVDEYQDTSPLQDAVIRLVARHSTDNNVANDNRFLVGDYKQSIYRFRHADPSLFQEKLDGPEGNPERDVRFSTKRLSENFRSRKGLLDFINACFTRFLDRKLGDVDYHGVEKLIPVTKDPPGFPATCVEAHWLPKTDTASDTRGDYVNDPDEQLESIEAQAAWIANRIRAMTGQGDDRVMITGNDGNLRPALPGDCAILVRTLSRELPVWIHALNYAGLKVLSPGVNPLFTTMELTDLINALKIVDNPVQDIPLSAVMRSPIGKFSDEDLFRISIAARSRNFAVSVFRILGRELKPGEKIHGESCKVIKDSEILPPSLVSRLESFMNLLDSWRFHSIHQSPSDVLERILEDTGYEFFLMGLSRPEERLRNLDHLRTMIREVRSGETGLNPLHSILNLLQRAAEEHTGLGDMPEKVRHDNQSVQLMTVHRSKGLEFPVVLLPRLERMFRNRPLGRILVDREKGMTLKGIDIENRISWDPLSYQMMALDHLDRDRSEELRILYVAMTRTRQRLLLCGQFKSPEQKVEEWSHHDLEQNRPAPVLLRRQFSSTANMIGPVIENILSDKICDVNADSVTRVIHDSLPRVKSWTAQDMIRRQIAETTPEQGSWARLTGQIQKHAASQGIPRETEPAPCRPIRLLPTFDPYESLTRIDAKKTVTRLKMNTGNQQDPDKQGPESDRFIEPDMARPLYVNSGTLTSRKPNWKRVDNPNAGERSSINQPMLRGTLMHELLEKLDLSRPLDPDDLQCQLDQMIGSGRFTLEGVLKEGIITRIDLESIAWFFMTDLGQKIIRCADGVSRELAFTLSRPIWDYAMDVGPPEHNMDENIILQGMIDVILADGDHFDVIDYKTDRITGDNQLQERVGSYRLQVLQYTRAIQAIWGVDSVAAHLVFLDCRKIILIEDKF